MGTEGERDIGWVCGLGVEIIVEFKGCVPCGWGFGRGFEKGKDGVGEGDDPRVGSSGAGEKCTYECCDVCDGDQ